MRTLIRDVRYGLRLLARNPGFTAIAVLTLGLGIGANTAIFSVVYGTLLEPMPYHDPDQLVMVWSKPRPDSRNSVAAGDFIDWRAQSTVFQGLHAWTGRTVSLAIGNERPEQIFASATTPGWITNFGYEFQLGRDFVPEEGVDGNDHQRHPVEPPLAGALGRRSRDRGQGDPARRQAAHRGRRAGTGAGRPHRAEDVPAARLHPGPDQPQLPLAAGHGPAQARRHGGTSERADGGHCQTHRRRLPRPEKGLADQRRAAAQQLPLPEHDQRALVPARRGRLRAPDRLRQRGEPAPRPGCFKAARGGAQVLPGRLAPSDRDPVPRGERAAGAPGRPLRARPGRRHHARDPGRDARLHPALRGGRAPEHPRAALHHGHGDRVRHPLRLRSRLAGHPLEPEREPEGGGARHDRRPASCPARAGGGRVRAGAHPPRRRRPGHSQPDEPEPGRPRLPYRKAADLLPARAQRAVEGRRARHPLLRPARGEASGAARRGGGDHRHGRTASGRLRDGSRHRGPSPGAGLSAGLGSLHHGHPRLLPDLWPADPEGARPHPRRTMPRARGSRWSTSPS